MECNFILTLATDTARAGGQIINNSLLDDNVLLPLAPHTLLINMLKCDVCLHIDYMVDAWPSLLDTINYFVICIILNWTIGHEI